jgi:hypothetical protein
MEYLGELSEALSDPAVAKGFTDNPVAYRGVLDELYRDPKSARPASRPGETITQQEARLARQQQAYKDAALAEAESVLGRNDLKEGDVVSHGTDLKGLLGMIFEGKLSATDPWGEGGKHWAGQGFGGASYLSKAAGRSDPGVLVILNNKGNRLGHIADFTTKAPTVKSDFVSAIITDGKSTVVLDSSALNALRSSAEAWSRRASDKGRPTWLRDCGIWKQWRRKLEPESG